jgi:hypothetical protein
MHSGCLIGLMGCLKSIGVVSTHPQTPLTMHAAWIRSLIGQGESLRSLRPFRGSWREPKDVWRFPCGMHSGCLIGLMGCLKSIGVVSTHPQTPLTPRLDPQSHWPRGKPQISAAIQRLLARTKGRLEVVEKRYPCKAREWERADDGSATTLSHVRG